METRVVSLRGARRDRRHRQHRDQRSQDPPRKCWWTARNRRDRKVAARWGPIRLSRPSAKFKLERRTSARIRQDRGGFEIFTTKRRTSSRRTVRVPAQRPIRRARLHSPTRPSTGRTNSGRRRRSGHRSQVQRPQPHVLLLRLRRFRYAPARPTRCSLCRPGAAQRRFLRLVKGARRSPSTTRRPRAPTEREASRATRSRANPAEPLQQGSSAMLNAAEAIMARPPATTRRRRTGI